MSKIDLTIHREILSKNVQKARENNCLLYTSDAADD